MPVATAFSVEPLVAACSAPEAEYRLLTQADLKAARARLVAAVQRLDQKLTATDATEADKRQSAQWKLYLKWDRLQAELGKDRPDPAELARLYKAFRGEHSQEDQRKDPNLKWECVAEVGDALQQYGLVAEVLASPEAAKSFRERHETTVHALPEVLRQYAAGSAPQAAAEIANRLRWLESTGQAPQLVAALRRARGGPNLHVQASAGLLSQGMDHAIDETGPVADVILGTIIHGDAHIRGRVLAQLVPDAKRGVFDLLFEGQIDTTSVGYNGPVRVYSTGASGVTARERLWMTADGLSALRPAADANLESQIDCIRSRRGRPMVERMAWRRALGQKSQADCIAEEHTEQRLSERLGSEIEALLANANDQYARKVRKPLDDRNLFPQQLDFSTTKEALCGAALRADRFQLAAHTKPPEVVQPSDLALCVHQSMINNLASSALAGTMVREKDFIGFLKRLGVTGDDLKRLESMENDPAWRIEFGQLPSPPAQVIQPLVVTFANGGFSVTVRAQRYFRGSSYQDQDPRDMDVTARYTIEQTADGFRAVRQGQIEVVSRKGEFAATTQSALLSRFETIFDEQILIEDLTVAGEWWKRPTPRADKGPSAAREPIKMKAVQCVCQDGWLVVAWRRAAADRPESSAAVGK